MFLVHVCKYEIEFNFIYSLLISVDFYYMDILWIFINVQGFNIKKKKRNVHVCFRCFTLYEVQVPL